MRIYTVHLPRRGGAPVLLREGFSWGALLFGPLWLAAQRAWLPAVLALCLYVLLAALPLPASVAWILGLALAWALGLWGHDLVRWSLAQRGYTLAHVVAGRDADGAFARLLDRRPDLAAGAAA